MRSNLRNIALISMGTLAGILISLGLGAYAQRESVKDARGPLPLEELRQLSEVLGLIKQSYVEPVEDKKLINDAINGMVSKLDPHSAYLDEKAFKDLGENLRGKFGGLGIQVDMEKEVVKVISPIEGTPAFKAGIRAGDYIVKVDGTSVRGMSLTQAVEKMRGEPGTKVKLHIERRGEANLLEFDLVRAEIPIISVRSKETEPGYAYIRLTQFIEPTLKDLVAEINRFYKDGQSPKGIILDLRYNPGGVLQGAVGVSSVFLPKDVLVVSSKGQLAEARTQSFARYEDYRTRADGNRLFSPDPLRSLPLEIKKVPLVVLINSGSASASEIVAGALQDYDRAKIIGTPSFGKGSVQQIFPLGEKGAAAVKVTIARYYTPKDRSIQAKGITPDFYVEETPEGDLFKNQLREVDLEGHLSNDKAVEAQKGDDEKYTRNPKRNKPIEFGTTEDYQLQQAINYLKGQPVKVSQPEKDTKADAKGDQGEKKAEVKAETKNERKATPKK